MEPVVEVLAKRALLEHLQEVHVRGRDDPHVHRDRVAAAHRRDLAVRDRREQRDLLLERHLPDLVEEQRAAVGLHEAPVAAPHAGRDLGQDAEQLALEQGLRDGAAVDGHERLEPPLAAVMENAGDELLACAVLAREEHGGVDLSRALHQSQHPLHREASADQALRVEPRADLLAQRQVLAHELLVRPHHLLVAAALLDRHRHQVRESLEQRAVLVTEHVGAPRVVEVDRAHHAPAQVHGHAHDRAQAQVEHARRARLRIARGVRDQQAAAALGDALDHTPAVADRVAPRVGVHRAVLGHGGEDAALGVREQQHAALGVELFDREAHRAAGQLAEVADRVEQPADGAEQVARPGGARLAGSDAAQPVHREGERLLAAAMVAEPLETRGRELEPRAHRGARFTIG